MTAPLPGRRSHAKPRKRAPTPAEPNPQKQPLSFGDERDGPAAPPTPAEYLRASQIRAAPLTWLWKGFIPQGLPTIVYGPLLTGKSTVLTSLAAAVTRGRAPTGTGSGKPEYVLWLAGEEPIEQLVQPRLAAAGANMDLIVFPQRPLAGGVRSWRLLEMGSEFAAVARHHRAALVVIDPIACFLGGEHPPEGNLAARLILGYLTQLGAETGVSCVGIKHPRKSGRGAATEQMSGGLEWMNTPRSVLLCAPHPTKPDTRVCRQQKPSLTEDAPGLEYQIEQRDGRGVCNWLRTSDLSAGELLADELSAPDRSALEEAREFLRTYLGESERRTTDLQKWAQESGLAWMTVRRAKTELGILPLWRMEDGTRYRVWAKPEKGWS